MDWADLSPVLVGLLTAAPLLWLIGMPVTILFPFIIGGLTGAVAMAMPPHIGRS